MPTQACCGLGCVPWPWLPARGGYLGHGCLALAACRGLGYMPWPWLPSLCCVPWPWLPSHGGNLGCCLPRPWQLAHWGLPWSWLHAVSLALALATNCPHIWSDFLKVRISVKMRLFPPRLQAGGIQGHAHVHTTPHRPASSRTPAKLARVIVHYCVPKFSP